MPTVPCPGCAQPVAIPDPPTASAYSCPHCRTRVPSAPTPPKPKPKPKPAAFEFDTDDEVDEPDVPRSHRRRRPQGNLIGDFLTFRLMVTPVVIQIVFWIGVLACLGFGISLIAAGLNTNDELRKKISVYVIAFGVLVMIAGPVVVRIYCELLIIFFKIHDELKVANDRQRYRS
ncbi:DUF4282 domain-containing protein [Frigoriglobus tundricola]|uniref:DUF4282 domain-containing protein n=1 Tax=Frigoriglobus tundricola TaxID=2774151 RepID=A0A6M5YJ59_9BACT|nr:DUF4282 domain-containing protein [Frigoriglobus tundricola]QJW93594.1 hypothetical protein FTUN_1101 [Frigoriglobus tundricola]